MDTRCGTSWRPTGHLHIVTFATPFLARPRSPLCVRNARCRQSDRQLRLRRRVVVLASARHGNDHVAPVLSADVAAAMSRRVVLVASAATKSGEQQTSSESGGQGLFGMQARAYWESMGFLPLFFAGFGVFALSIKLLKVIQGRWRSGANGVNRAMTPDSVITSPEMEQELHVYKCGGCGYEIYPARGREFKFFPDSFKCPLCETPKSEFWDLNDPNDARNQVEEEEEDDDDDRNLQPAGVPDTGGPGEGAEGIPVSDAPNTPKADASEPKAEK